MPVIGRKRRKQSRFDGGSSRAVATEGGCTDQASKDGMEFLDIHGDIDKLGWLDRLPLLNVVNDIFFDIPPTPEQLRESLNIIALVSALLMAVLAALPFSYGYDDYMAAIDRLNNHTFEVWETGELFPAGTHERGTGKYINVAHTFTLGFVSLASGLIFAVVIYLFMAHSSFRGPDGKLNSAMLVEWWKYARFVTLFCFGVTVYGIVLAFVSLGELFARPIFAEN